MALCAAGRTTYPLVPARHDVAVAASGQVLYTQLLHEYRAKELGHRTVP